MKDNQSNLFIIRNGKHVQMTPSQLFDKHRFNQIRLVTYSISPNFIFRYFSNYQYIHITAGIKPHTKVQLEKDLSILKGVFNVLQRIHFWNYSANNLLINDERYILRIPHNVHSKIYLLSNNETTDTRVIEGSANLSFAGMGARSNQNEDLTVYDNNSKIFKQYLDNYNQINKDSFIWTSNFSRNKKKFMAYNPKIAKEVSSSECQNSPYIAIKRIQSLNDNNKILSHKNKIKVQELKESLKSAKHYLAIGNYKQSIKVLNSDNLINNYYNIATYQNYPKELCTQYDKILSKDYLAVHDFFSANCHLSNLLIHSTNRQQRCRALFDKVHCEQKLSKTDDYKEDLLRALKLRKCISKADKADVLNYLSDIAVQDENKKLAIKYLKQARALDKDNKLYNFKLGRWYQGHQDTAKAIHYLRKSYLHSADICIRLGDLYSVQSKQSKTFKQKYEDKAIRYYVKGLSCSNAKEISLTEAKAKCCQRLHMLLIASQLYSNVVHNITNITTNKHTKAKNIIVSIKIDLKVNHEKLGNNLLEDSTPFNPNDSCKNICNVEQAITLDPTNTKYYHYLSKLEERYGLQKQSIFNEKIATLLKPNQSIYKHRLAKLISKYQDKNINSNSNAESKLNQLVGLHSVKESIKTIINRALIDKIRHHTKQHQQLHLVFEGNAGTGKTTVAKLLCHILYDKHVILKNKCVETSGTALIRSHYGESAKLIRHMIHEAIGGVLFIDEAYHLQTRKDGNDACQDEAVDELVNDIEKHKHDVVVVLAGYTQPMEHFINCSNQGLSSRFPKNDRIIFPNYSASECWQILQLYLNQNNMIVNKNAVSILHDYINKYVHRNTGHGFGNARTIRNIFSSLMNCFANRVSKNLSKHDITLLKDKSIPDRITVQDVTNLIQH